ncbi:MAG: NYN domain-containing protein [Aureliella sp.]
MTVRLLIDGYNLLYATGAVAQARGPGGLARARERLLGQLGAALPESQRQQTQIVFDARRVPVRGECEQSVRGITVTFSAGFEEADDLLEQLIRQHPNPRTLLVVSSDQRVQRCAKSRKAQSVTCDQWLMQIADGPLPEPVAEPPEPIPRDRTPQLSTEEVARWLEEFGLSRLQASGVRPQENRKGQNRKPEA